MHYVRAYVNLCMKVDSYVRMYVYTCLPSLSTEAASLISEPDADVVLLQVEPQSIQNLLTTLTRSQNCPSTAPAGRQGGSLAGRPRSTLAERPRQERRGQQRGCEGVQARRQARTHGEARGSQSAAAPRPFLAFGCVERRGGQVGAQLALLICAYDSENLCNNRAGGG